MTAGDATTRAPELLRLGGVSVRFTAAGSPALDAVDLDVAAREIVCVLGPSGSGKSTLLRVVAGLQHADAGQVLLEGREQRGARAPAWGRPDVPGPPALPAARCRGQCRLRAADAGAPRAERERTVAELLDLVGLPGTQRRAVASLSGGEQQRVALARALAPVPGC